MGGCIAVINAGSSSIKLAIYEAGDAEALLYRGKVEGLGDDARLEIRDAEGAVVAARDWPHGALDHRAATTEILERARTLTAGRAMTAVGHRVVHGGAHYSAPVRVDPGVVARLRALVPLAPLHQPHNLGPIEAIAEAAPDIPQVACFDTAFHQGQPPLARLLGLPRRYLDEGVRRYGFHGLSYEYVSSRLSQLAPRLARGRVIIAHLGAGASLCGLVDGGSIATSMGFTAVDGLLMGTRCGALDPGVMIYLMDVHGLGPRELEDLIYRQSGLLGLSGVSSDMRALRASSEPAAAEAVAFFVYRAVREIGSIAAAIGGVDAIVFTGGIGENDAATRAEIVQGCAWLRLSLDAARNAAGGPRITTADSAVEAWVIPTDEERMIARHTSALLGLKAAAG
jgi:acetate kinase